MLALTEFFRAMLAEPDGCDRFLAAVIEPLTALMARLRASSRPVIAAVNGVCAAGGLELILACDLVVADTGATFTDAHAGLGIAPAVGAAAGLVRALGELRAKQILLLSEPVGAATMAAYGLVAEVTPPGELERRTTELAGTLSRRSPVSVAAMKAMVHQALQPTWDETLQSRPEVFPPQLELARHAREGLDAYAALSRAQLRPAFLTDCLRRPPSAGAPSPSHPALASHPPARGMPPAGALRLRDGGRPLGLALPALAVVRPVSRADLPGLPQAAKGVPLDPSRWLADPAAGTTAAWMAQAGHPHARGAPFRSQASQPPRGSSVCAGPPLPRPSGVSAASGTLLRGWFQPGRWRHWAGYGPMPLI